MIICELCLYREGSECKLGLRTPKGMSCREFGAVLDRFCANANDFVNARQVVEMATYFGVKGSELKKVKLMAARAESDRL